jgi:two-component system sensor histidine kinase BaeS
MSMRRKLTLAMGGFILGMGAVFFLVTLTVVWGILYAFVDVERGDADIVRLGVASSVSFFLILFGLVLVLIALWAASRLARKMTAPLESLMAAIERFGNGEPDARAPVAGGDEIGKVAETFNSMAERIRRSEQLRRQMTADVAHELRTPVTILRGKLEWFQHNNRPVEPVELLPLMDELIRLSRLIDDLHQLSLAEARRLALDVRPVDLGGLLRRVVGHFEPEAEEKGISLELDCGSGSAPASPAPGTDAPGPAMTVMADANRLTQVFANLLGNAVRYTPEGGRIVVRARRLAAAEIAAREKTVTCTGAAIETGGHGWVEVRVADSGIGIEPEHLPHVFERFYRTDEARTRERGGAGLGLAIAKELVLAHGGTIRAESEPGRGTVFTVALPLARVVQEEPEARGDGRQG